MIYTDQVMFNAKGIVIDGKKLSLKIFESLKDEIATLTPKFGRPPGFATILVGEYPPSQLYIKSKQKVAKDLGANVFAEFLPENYPREQLLKLIESYNKNENVDGILVQQPLPSHLNRNEILRAVLPEKDVDGLHPLNQGLIGRGEAGPRPCTPNGVLALIDLGIALVKGEVNEEKIVPPKDLSGFKAVVIGRSILVGQPAASMLLERNATVTMTHSKTKNLKEEIAAADIVVAACGQLEFIKGEWIKKGAIVIDVGITKQNDGKIVGDVEFGVAKTRAAAITPVPGGVGPMTIAMLMHNTVDAWKNRLQNKLRE